MDYFHSLLFKMDKTYAYQNEAKLHKIDVKAQSLGQVIILNMAYSLGGGSVDFCSHLAYGFPKMACFGNVVLVGQSFRCKSDSWQLTCS